MSKKYRLFRRGKVFWSHNGATGKQKTLQTKDRITAERLIHALNEAEIQPSLNLQIARAYLMGSNPEFTTRTWAVVMRQILIGKGWEEPKEYAPEEKEQKSTEDQKEKMTDHQRATLRRWEVAVKSKAFDEIRNLTLLETTAPHFFRAMADKKVSTNVYLRRIHNYALDFNYLPTAVIPKKKWPPVKFKEKRAIKLGEHLAIVAREHNFERRAFYQIAWHTGASQSDIAFLEAGNIDWPNKVITYERKKTGEQASVRFGGEVAKILRGLPEHGPLFPYLRAVRAGDRATEFKQRCIGLSIKDVSLHSYRYAWAERARLAGMPERFAQDALGQQSVAVHRAYASKAEVIVPALEDYEKCNCEGKVIPLATAAID